MENSIASRIPDRLNSSTAGADLAAHIAAGDFPCIGAKAALARDGIQLFDGGDIESPSDDIRLHRALVEFVRENRQAPNLFRSFAALFHGPCHLSEQSFERALWKRLQALADRDRQLGHCYDPCVSSNPDDPDFSMSFGGEAFFVVGLHPRSSRPARRFGVPGMIFNPHNQFVQLRAEGRYERLRERTLLRDKALAGSVNPMLAPHGQSSAARQYSGRMVDEGWRCPFAYEPEARTSGVGT